MADFAVHPIYEATVTGPSEIFDIAVITLADFAPDSADRYRLYQDQDEFGQIYTVVGYGVAGTGASGQVFGASTDVRRFGQNVFDTDAETAAEVFIGGDISDLAESFLLSDFDSGLPSDDIIGSFGLTSGPNGLGLGLNEVISTSGDSGGPLFLDGDRIAGVVSLGFREDDRPTGAFAEVDFATRVSESLDFIQARLFNDDEGISFFENTGGGASFFTFADEERDFVFDVLPAFRYAGSLDAASADEDGAVAVFRFFNPSTGAHFFTADEGEAQFLTEFNILNAEGIGFFAFADGGEGRVAVHRFFDLERFVHVYAFDEEDVAAFLADETLSNEGVAFYAAIDEDATEIEEDALNITTADDAVAGMLFA